MKYQLINSVNPSYSALEQILTNRGIKYEDIPHYINTTDEDINSFLLLGEDKLREAVSLIIKTIKCGKDIVIVVDSDVDGYCSAAIMINYLYDVFPHWTENHLLWIIHEGKQHGLKDTIDKIINKEKCGLVLLPDSGTNDLDEHKILKDKGIYVICLDHHEIESNSQDAIVITSQDKNYPNKALCGGGVVYQFCRYIDNILNESHSENYLDLVALSLTADMMSLTSIETKHLINKGFEPNNIHNAFIRGMWEKNKFKLGEHITSWGAAFYIAPFVNAINRSGTQEEKEIVFESMLKMRAFNEIPSTKRGCKDQTETLIEQAVRTCMNVKRRQDKDVESNMEFLENKIIENNMMNDKVLLFLLEPGQIDKNIAGLAGNKIMSKYQRPCCILTKVKDINSYQGSARGCEIVDVKDFKSICEKSGLVNWCIGHASAFGISISENNINEFIKYTNEVLKDMPKESCYYVDYIYEGINVNPQNILDIAYMDSYWGRGIQESLIAIEGLKVTKDMVTLMSADRNPTLKITLPNKVSIIKFKSSQQEYESLLSEGYVELNIVGKSNANEWLGNVTPQILVEEYEIVASRPYCF